MYEHLLFFKFRISVFRSFDDSVGKICHESARDAKTSACHCGTANQSAEDVYPLVLEMCGFILDFEGEIPGARPEECGNWSEQNLDMAKYYIRRYAQELTENRRLTYPE